MNRRSSTIVVTVAAVLWALSGVAVREAAAATKTTRVTYLAGGSVYVDAGRLDGLQATDSLTVLRGGAVVARLRVAFLSSHRASCDTFAVRAHPVIGDVVTYVAHEIVPVSAPADSNPAVPQATAPPVVARPQTAVPVGGTSPGLRGRAGLRLLAVQGGTGIGYTQPAFDLRADRLDPRGHMDFALDVRSRRTIASSDPAADDQALTRIHRFSTTVHDRRARWNLTLGRQRTDGFSAVNLFDGALAEMRTSRMSFRLFGGTQPNPVSMAMSTDIAEHGAAVEWRSAAAPGAGRRWSVSTGGVSSYHGGGPNRDFAFVHGFVADPRWFVSASQEVDVARGWKQAAGEPAVSLTSTFVIARVAVSGPLELRAGYDARRNVRLWRDRFTPEDEFDDRYRRGGWLGFSVRPTRLLRVSAEARAQGTSVDDRTRTGNGTVELMRVTPLLLTLRLRGAWADGSVASSSLYSVGLGADPASGVHLEFAGGTRITREQLTGLLERTLWESADVDVALAARWYLSATYERTHGDAETTHQEYAGLSWSF